MKKKIQSKKLSSFFLSSRKHAATLLWDDLIQLKCKTHSSIQMPFLQDIKLEFITWTYKTCMSTCSVGTEYKAKLHGLRMKGIAFSN